MVSVEAAGLFSEWDVHAAQLNMGVEDPEVEATASPNPQLGPLLPSSCPVLSPAFPHPDGPYCQLALLEHCLSVLPVPQRQLVWPQCG